MTINPALPSTEIIRTLLDATDNFATENVEAGRGGPFGASIHIYNSKTGELYPVSGLKANAVLVTGIASAHAEDQAVDFETVRALKMTLKHHKKEIADLSVIFTSSAESCPACHAKEEILARDLVNKELLAPGRFFVVFGATYQDSRDVAGFNDAPYHADMQQTPGTGLIRQERKELTRLPLAVEKIFTGAKHAVAVIVLKDGTCITGYDERTENSLMATAEVSAIRQACTYQKENGSLTPWDLEEAQLYTMTDKIGPLAYAEAQWANVTRWVTVASKKDQSNDLRNRETPNLSNRDFFKRVAGQYNQRDMAVQVLRIEPFANKAQHSWREKLTQEDASKLLYNGIKTSI